jgi:acyl-coenzyme A thioesterase PaaI-like protein
MGRKYARAVRAPDGPIRHHDLCFGCGQANLFGIQLELERREDGGVGGRFFVKQDHQGPPGHVHGGVLSAALDEAMALLVHSEGTLGLTAHLEIDFEAPVPVGTFVEVRADVASVEGERVVLTASAASSDEPDSPVASAQGVFRGTASPA